MNRVLKLDGLKFVLIFLVVLGHLPFYDYGLGIKKIIYSFHMPVFIFLSGFFTSLNCSLSKRKEWIRYTLLLFFCIQLVHSLLNFIIDDGVGISAMFFRTLIYPNYALWYLVCLIYWRVAVWYIFKGQRMILLFIISVLLAAVAGFIPLNDEFSFQRAFAFFPYFVMGLIFREYHLIGKLNEISYPIAIVGLFLCFVVVRNLPLYMPKFHYYSWVDMLYRMIQFGFGLILSLLIIRVSQIKVLENFANLGRYTLWIYIGHTFVIRLGEYVFPSWWGNLDICIATLITFVCCALFICIAKCKTAYICK